MRALPSATIICRALVGLDRAAATGTLEARSSGKLGRVLLASGRVVGASVDRRVATAPAHVAEGVYRMGAWEGVDLRFSACASRPAGWLFDDPLDTRLLALQTMRRTVREMDATSVRIDLGRGVYRMTAAGEDLLAGLDLHEPERALLFWLRRGVRAEDVPALPGCGLKAYRFLCCLKLLRAAAPRRGSFPLLLRKRQQVRQRVSPHDLLDLPPNADRDDARRALRKLVAELHPDRFGNESPPAVRRASGEVVTALVQAQDRIGRRRS